MGPRTCADVVDSRSVAGCGACALHEELTRIAFETEGLRLGLWFGYQHGVHLIDAHGMRPYQAW